MSPCQESLDSAIIPETPLQSTTEELSTVQCFLFCCLFYFVLFIFFFKKKKVNSISIQIINLCIIEYDIYIAILEVM